MKTPFYFSLLPIACWVLILSAQNLIADATSPTAPTIFMVKTGEFPWSDRVNGWALSDVPASVAGNGPLPQQLCSAHTIEVPDQTKSIIFAVSNHDLDKFKTIYPTAQTTGEVMSVSHVDGTGSIPYTLLKMDNPPAGLGSPDFAAGLILLQLNDKGAPAASSDSVPPASTPAQAAQAGPAPFKPPQTPFDTGDKTKLHIFILMGQSNMVGRDTTGLEAQTADPRLGYFDGQKWIVALEPMGGAGSGFGPGTFFAKAMLPLYPDGKIGLVPCAVGGTPLSRWVKGADLYENAVKRAKQAATSGIVEGMLWHQGESDSMKPEDATTYETRLTQMFRDFRQDLGQPNLPIVVGQLGGFVKFPHIEEVKAALAHLPGDLPLVGLADSTGLTDKGDHLHFNTASQTELGKRYADAMQKLQKPASTP